MSSGHITEDFLSLAKSFDQQAALTELSGRSITYSELAKRIEDFSSYLRSIGLRKGGRVALLQPKCIESVIAIFAVLESEATYIPIDPGISANRIQFLLRDADPDLLIVDPNLFPSEIPCQLEICSLVEGMGNTATAVLNRNTERENKLAYVLYTSGSTGTPKGVCVSHLAARAFVDWSKETFHLEKGEHVASIAPFHFDLSVFDLFASLSSGCTLHLYNSEEVKNVRLMAEQLSKQKINCIYATPSFFTSLLLYGKPDKFSWESIREVLFAGEEFPVKHLHVLMTLWNNARFYNLYGPSETNVCTWTEIHKEENRTKPYPIGLPCRGHEYEISEEDELIIGGPHVSEGYLNNEELTQLRFFVRDNMRWFKTGDIVMQDDSGQLIYKGRIDRMIKRRGYRIEPAEVEQALMMHPAINSAAVVCVQGDDEMPVLVAFMTGRNVPGIIEVKEYLLKYVPDYVLPDAVMNIDVIPTTATGKVDYRQMIDLWSKLHGKVL